VVRHPAADPKQRPKSLSVHDARAIIRSMAQESARVFVVTHARNRQRTRNITRRQIINCLQKGSITEGPVLNTHGNWQVNVSRLAAGEEITCTVAIEWERRLVVVTVFRG